MKCVICDKYEGQNRISPIVEIDGVTLSHIAPGDDGWAMKGRLIVEPVRHVVNPEDLSSTEFANMGRVLQIAMGLLKDRLGAEHVYFFRINDLVAHFHFHVLPRFPGTPKEFWGMKLLDWTKIPMIRAEEIQSLSEELRKCLL
ncbi:MAG: hypothetical protein KDD25_05375 [Bdellovibrionales bacterium]|nr:hypothetical protein [Bdellovibrionales bacterium]